MQTENFLTKMQEKDDNALEIKYSKRKRNDFTFKYAEEKYGRREEKCEE